MWNDVNVLTIQLAYSVAKLNRRKLLAIRATVALSDKYFRPHLTSSGFYVRRFPADARVRTTQLNPVISQIPLICLWHREFADCRLLELFPSLAHVEDKTLIHPHWLQLNMLFGNVTYDWSGQYSTHVWRRFGNVVPMSPRYIATLNSTIGQMMRYIYNGPRE